MTSLSRHHVASSSALLMRILERPELVSAVQDLPPPVLGSLIDRIGLEDAGELVALASTAQLERIFDDDLWKAADAGDDEKFRPDRFALWLRIMLEGGEAYLVQRLCELPQDLLTLAIQRLVLVIDMDLLGEQLSGGPMDEIEGLERALEATTFEEWEEFRIIARDVNAWDDVWNALLALDRDHHDRLRAILEQCCAMTTEYISGNGGLFEVLTSDEMLENDVAAERDNRRAAEGFISPADARSFLELARRGDTADVRDPITHAYFRDLAPPAVEKPAAATQSTRTGAQLAAAQKNVTELLQLLASADVVTPANAQPLAALGAGAKPRKASASKRSKPAAASKSAAPVLEAAL
ncbi:MAG TPA: DUF6178 family protein, partial [Polyangiales bacterium]|nr:DUF6178 family protein [Polyangiales bacterium]